MLRFDWGDGVPLRGTDSSFTSEIIATAGCAEHKKFLLYLLDKRHSTDI
jgi:hypothetical protein